MKSAIFCLASALALLVTAAAATAQTQAHTTPPTRAFEFKDGDRVVILGGTVVEREQRYGFLETALTLAVGKKQISVRNLGWSGDTVFGHARSYFGPPAEGLERLGKHLETLKPTVLIACYGADLPFEGLIKMPEFISGYRNLLELVRSKNPHVRVIVVSPPPLENLGAPLPDQTEANAKLEDVRNALKEFAGKQGAFFVDGFELMGGAHKERPANPITENGIHYAEAGYQQWAAKMLEGLGLPKQDPASPAAKPLRENVIKKDNLFFNRWRPANETYLYGFRKHEQGQNAAEVEQFDALVSVEDKKIQELKLQVLQLQPQLP
jgi:lysophospholipase L1-like esterase